MRNGADPYAERELADTPVTGAPPWLGVVEGAGGAVVEATEDLASPDAGSRLLVVVDRGVGVTPPLARLTPQLAAIAVIVATGPRHVEATGLVAAFAASSVPVFALKHGWVAGPEGQPGGVEVTAELVAAALALALAPGTRWETDPDFGWDLPRAEGDAADLRDVLMPRLHYAKHGRVYEHAARVPAEQRARYEALRAAGIDDQELLALTHWPAVPTADTWK